MRSSRANTSYATLQHQLPPLLTRRFFSQTINTRLPNKPPSVPDASTSRRAEFLDLHDAITPVLPFRSVIRLSTAGSLKDTPATRTAINMSFAANCEDIEHLRHEQRAQIQAAMTQLHAARVTNTPLPILYSKSELLTAPPMAEPLTFRHIDLPCKRLHPNPTVFIHDYVSAADAVAAGVPTWTTLPSSGKVANAQMGSRQRLAQMGYDERLEGEPRRIDDDSDGNARWMASNVLKALPFKVKLLDSVYKAYSMSSASISQPAPAFHQTVQTDEESTTALRQSSSDTMLMSTVACAEQISPPTSNATAKHGPFEGPIKADEPLAFTARGEAVREPVTKVEATAVERAVSDAAESRALAPSDMAGTTPQAINDNAK